LPSLGFYGLLYFSIRNIINYFQLLLLRRPKLAAKRSNALLLAATKSTRKSIWKYYKINSFILPEVGTHIKPIISENDNSTMNLIWIGRLIPGKALNLLLDSLPFLKDINYKLHIVGEGPCKVKWQKKAAKLDISDNLIWYGWVDHSVVYDILSNGSVMCITSMHDLTSTVILEALSSGLPVICPDHCGFSYVIDGTCGIKIPVSKPNEFIKDYSKALIKLSNFQVRNELKLGAIKRSEVFNWKMKIKELNYYYNKLLKIGVDSK